MTDGLGRFSQSKISKKNNQFPKNKIPISENRLGASDPDSTQRPKGETL